MSQPQTAIPVCRSVFKKGASATTTETYTRIWITLINQIEKGKAVLAEIR